MLKQPLLAIAVMAACLAPGAGFPQQADSFSLEPDTFTCAPPFGPVVDTPTMSQQNTVERVVRAGQTTLCLTRDSNLVVTGLRCRTTEGIGDGDSGTSAGGSSSGGSSTGGTAQGAGGSGGRAGAQGGGGNAAAGGAQSSGAQGSSTQGSAAAGASEVERTWGCPMGRACGDVGGFLSGSRQATLDPSQTRFCVRYLNADGEDQKVRVDFVFDYPGR